jgi:regulator-associated protein of mTOR
MVMQLPGDLKDRRTPLGELNWIFTAITDTIAWTTFPRDVFTRLYRSDLLIASLFRNFLLAERIMKNYHCTPVTYPALPTTNTHQLWAAWDLALDTCLRQLPELLAKTPDTSTSPAIPATSMITRPGQRGSSNAPLIDKPYQYIPSRFFTDQLTAFEVWISRGGSALTKRGPLSLPLQNGGDRCDTPDIANGSAAPEANLVPRKPPDQLPIVLQVLLSQPHRLRALILLSQFVDLGPWAVNLVLTIGIFPYISKLLQAAGQDLRPVLIFIWARILAVDPSVQVDLYNTGGFKYFANVLATQEDNELPNSSEHKAMCAFILGAVARDFYNGQMACWRERVFDACFEHLEEGDFLLRQWSALCIAQIWDANDEVKVYGVDRGTQDRLILMLSDDSPEVRSAVLYALSTFLGAAGGKGQGGGGSGTQYQLEERIHFRMEVAVATGATLAVRDDASPMVRKELLVLISCLVREWRGHFVVCAWMYWEEDRRWRAGDSHAHHHHMEDEVTSQALADWLDGFGDDENAREENRVLLSSFFTIFVVLLELTIDPYHEVATLAQTVMDYIFALLLASPFARLDLVPPLPVDYRPIGVNGVHSRAGSAQTSPMIPHPPSPVFSRPGPTRSDTMSSTISSGVTTTLRRTSSFANALRHLEGGIAFPSMDEARAPLSPGLPSHARPDTLLASRPPSPNLNVAQYASPYSRPPTPSRDIEREREREWERDLHSPPVSPTAAPANFSPSHVMEALVEEDMVRLRARRRAGTHGRRSAGSAVGSSTIGGGLNSPSGSTFSMDSKVSTVPLGCGTGNGLRDVLPLKSSFFNWCCEYFTEPQMRVCARLFIRGVVDS